MLGGGLNGTGGRTRRLGVGAVLLVCLALLPGQAAADDPAFTVAASSGPEGGSVTFTTAFAEPVPDGGYTLSYSVTHGTTSAEDFSGSTSGNIGVPATATSAEITLQLAEDSLDEFDETFALDVTREGGGTNTANGTITGGGDTPPSAQIGDVEVTEGQSGTVAADFPIQLSGPSGKPVTVRYSTADGTASAPGDYEAASNQSVTINPGETSGTIRVNVKGDTLPEGSEFFFVNLTSVDNGNLGADTQGRGQINDDDVPPSASIDDVTVTEGNNPANVNARFTVTLSGPAPAAVQIKYKTLDNSAQAPADYTAIPDGTLNIPKDASSGQFDIVVKGDSLPEGTGSPPAESFFVDLISATGATISSDSRGRGQINDDDTPPAVESISSPIVTEGNSSNESQWVKARFVVKLSANAPAPVTVRYSTRNGSAVAAPAPGDYVAASNQDLVIPAGASEGTIEIAVKGDTLPEGTGDPRAEEFFVDLLSATGATFTPGPGMTGTAKIVDDDEQPTISVTGAEVTEGTGGAVLLDFKVKLSRTTAQQVQVIALTQDGTALSTSDYKFLSKPIVWAANTPADELEKTFSVEVLGDALDEKTETLLAKLESPQNATILPEGAQAIGTIVDNDSRSLLSAADTEANEGSGGTTSTMTFKITLLPVSDRPVAVNYATANGTATAGSDYTAAQGQVTFAEGETEKTVAVTVLGDDLNEENETVMLNLSGPSGAALASGGAQGIGTIVDKNAPPSLSISDTMTREGTGATFTVTLAGSTLREVKVGFNTADGTAKAGSDYSDRRGTLTFAVGEKSKTIAVTVLDDTASESSEEFYVTLGDPVNATITKSRGVAAIEASDQVATPPTTQPRPVAKPAAVLLPRMVLGPANVSVGANGIARMSVTCQKASPIGCAGTIELERATKPLLKLGKRAFAVKRAGKGFVSIKLAARGLALLRKNGTLRARVIVVVKTSVSTKKVVPGVITLKNTAKTKAKANPKPKPPTTKVFVDP